MNHLEKLRIQIGEIDRDIIALIAKRQAIAGQIGEYKRIHHLSVTDPVREELLSEFHCGLANKHGLTASLVQQVFKLLIESSKEVQSL